MLHKTMVMSPDIDRTENNGEVPLSVIFIQICDVPCYQTQIIQKRVWTPSDKHPSTVFR